MSDELFRQKAPGIMRRLIDDFGLTEVQAAGILGNIGHECSGFRLLREISPLNGGLGGFGWAQWIGSRRRDFKQWCTDHGFTMLSDEGNYAFLRHELQTTHERAITVLKTTDTLRDAVKEFERIFEVAGVKHYDSRERWARIALQEFHAALVSPDLAFHEPGEHESCRLV
jgi:Phage tail lysozyme